MLRSILLGLAATTIIAVPASAAVKPKSLLRLGGTGSGYVSADGSKTFRVPKGYPRIRIVAQGTSTVQTYTRDADYNKITGPIITVPAKKVSGRATITCYRSADDIFGIDRSRTYGTGTTTVRLPVSRSTRCQLRLSVDAFGASTDYPDEETGTVVTATADLIR